MKQTELVNDSFSESCVILFSTCNIHHSSSRDLRLHIPLQPHEEHQQALLPNREKLFLILVSLPNGAVVHVGSRSEHDSLTPLHLHKSRRCQKPLYSYVVYSVVWLGHYGSLSIQKSKPYVAMKFSSTPSTLVWSLHYLMSIDIPQFLHTKPSG
jgi:hypothetical protein